MAEIPTEVFLVIGQDGKPWTDTVATTEHGAQTRFVKDWLSVFRVETMDVYHVWNMAKRSGFTMKRLAIAVEE